MAVIKKSACTIMVAMSVCKILHFCHLIKSIDYNKMINDFIDI